MLGNLVQFALLLGSFFAADPTAPLDNGAIITGVNEDGVSKFLGIPYALPPWDHASSPILTLDSCLIFLS